MYPNNGMYATTFNASHNMLYIYKFRVHPDAAQPAIDFMNELIVNDAPICKLGLDFFNKNSMIGALVFQQSMYVLYTADSADSAFPSLRNALAVASTAFFMDPAAPYAVGSETEFTIEYLCATPRAPAGAGRLLAAAIACDAKAQNAQKMCGAVDGRNETKLKTLYQGYGMDCQRDERGIIQCKMDLKDVPAIPITEEVPFLIPSSAGAVTLGGRRKGARRESSRVSGRPRSRKGARRPRSRSRGRRV